MKPATRPCLIACVLVSMLMSLSSASASAAGTVEEAQTWYEQQYAPLWRDSKTTNPAEIAKFYADVFRQHPADKPSFTTKNSVAMWKTSLKQYVAAGWRGGELKTIRVEPLNQSTVRIQTRWSSIGPHGAQPDTCDIYIAGKFAAGWKFTNHIETSCPEQ